MSRNASNVMDQRVLFAGVIPMASAALKSGLEKLNATVAMA